MDCTLDDTAAASAKMMTLEGSVLGMGVVEVAARNGEILNARNVTVGENA